MAALCTAVASGCATRPHAAAVTSPDVAVQLDTEQVCQRTHTAGGWTQLIYQTPTWRDLAERADRGDPDAWDEIGDLIAYNRQHVRDTLCTKSMLRNVRASASRLGHSG